MKVICKERYVSAFVRVCERRRKLKINVGKIIVKHLGVDFALNGRMDAELNYRSLEVRKCAGVLNSVWKNRSVSMKTKKIVVPTALYSNEAWVLLENKVKNIMDVAEMSSLRSM